MCAWMEEIPVISSGWVRGFTRRSRVKALCTAGCACFTRSVTASAATNFLRAWTFLTERFANLRDSEFRVTLRGEEELRVVVQMEDGKITGHTVETKDFCIFGPDELVSVACDRILEISIARKLLPLGKRQYFALMIALWEGGLPVDMLPSEGWLEIALGAEHFAWPIE